MDNPIDIYSGIDQRIVDKWLDFARRNLVVILEIEHRAERLRLNGYQKYSIRTIVEGMRWEHDRGVNIDRGDCPFRFNNNHNSCLVRWLVNHNPELDGFFEMRTKGKGK